MKNSPITLLAGTALVAVLLAGCGSLTSAPAASTATTLPAASATTATPTPASTQPSTPAARTTTAVPVPPAPPVQAPAGNPPQPQLTNASAVIAQFYQDITDHAYQAAWALGGDNIGGTDYNSWVAGYSTTANISLGAFSSFGASQVKVELIATQVDSTIKYYTGTYTVYNGVITAASIVQD